MGLLRSRLPTARPGEHRDHGPPVDQRAGEPRRTGITPVVTVDGVTVPSSFSSATSLVTATLPSALDNDATHTVDRGRHERRWHDGQPLVELLRADAGTHADPAFHPASRVIRATRRNIRWTTAMRATDTTVPSAGSIRRPTTIRLKIRCARSSPTARLPQRHLSDRTQPHRTHGHLPLGGNGCRPLQALPRLGTSLRALLPRRDQHVRAVPREHRTRVQTAIADGNTSCTACHDGDHGGSHDSAIARSPSRGPTQASAPTARTHAPRATKWASSSSTGSRPHRRPTTAAPTVTRPRATPSLHSGTRVASREAATPPARRPPQHGLMSVSHVPLSENAPCLVCHTKGDLGALHLGATDQTNSSCFVCHAGGKVPTTKNCVTCHPDRVEPHGYFAEDHQSDIGSQTLSGGYPGGITLRSRSGAECAT